MIYFICVLDLFYSIISISLLLFYPVIQFPCKSTRRVYQILPGFLSFPSILPCIPMLHPQTKTGSLEDIHNLPWQRSAFDMQTGAQQPQNR